jgi:hypothetical protein
VDGVPDTTEEAQMLSISALAADSKCLACIHKQRASIKRHACRFGARAGETMVIKPTINTDGTAPRVLLDQHLKAIDTLRYAISTLQSTEPNARDYQTAPIGTFTAAMHEHRDRLRRLRTVMDELQEIAEHISDQG